jgi:hypothetical protein
MPSQFQNAGNSPSHQTNSSENSPKNSPKNQLFEKLALPIIPCYLGLNNGALSIISFINNRPSPCRVLSDITGFMAHDPADEIFIDQP